MSQPESGETPGMSTVLSVESVSKRYRVQRDRPRTLRESVIRRLQGHRERRDSVWALRDVTFTVERGLSLGIVGHNGAGKSTLLRLLCGLGRPTTGRIVREGHLSGLLELGGGFHLDLSGRDNMVTAGILSGLTERQVRAREREIIAFSELEDFIDQPVRTYSTGMYLRLAFAVAVCFDPAILAIDEVLAVGDSRFQQKCLDRIAGFRAAGKTLLITSHSRDQILALCDEVLVLEEGRAVMRGDPETALACYDDLMRQRTERRALDLLGERAVRRLRRTSGARQGTQEAKIVRVRMTDTQGREVRDVRSPDGVTIHLDYEVAEGIDDVALSVGIFSEGHVKCFDVVLASAAAVLGPLGRAGTIRCRLPALPLLAGEYFINVGLYPLAWDFVYDYHWQMHALRVVADREIGGEVSGVVALSPAWGLTLHEEVHRATPEVDDAGEPICSLQGGRSNQSR